MADLEIYNGDMIIEYDVADGTISSIRNDTVNKNSIMSKRVVVWADVGDNEVVYFTFGQNNGDGFVAITDNLLATTQDRVDPDTGETIGGYKQYVKPIPNSILANTGTYGISISIKVPVGTDEFTGEVKYALVTSGVYEFTISSSLAMPDFTEIDETDVDVLQGEINTKADKNDTGLSTELTGNTAGKTIVNYLNDKTYAYELQIYNLAKNKADLDDTGLAKDLSFHTAGNTIAEDLNANKTAQDASIAGAISTANTASANATTAITTANSAETKADEALAIVTPYTEDLEELETQLPLIEQAIIDANAAANAAAEMEVVADITERNDLVGKKQAFVIDATGDETVASGGATYVYNGTSWVKTSEAESLDLVLTAANTSVTATPTNYTAATANVEAHLAGIDTELGNKLDKPEVAGADNEFLAADNTWKVPTTDIAYTPAQVNDLNIFQAGSPSYKESILDGVVKDLTLNGKSDKANLFDKSATPVTLSPNTFKEVLSTGVRIYNTVAGMSLAVRCASIPVIAGQTYTLSANITATSGVAKLRIDSTTAGYLNASQTSPLTVTIPTGTTAIQILLYCTESVSEVGNVKYENLQFQDGSAVKTYDEFANIKSVQGSTKIVSTGKNLLSSKLESGGIIWESGLNSVAPDNMRTKDFISIAKNSVVKCSELCNIWAYDSNYNYLYKLNNSNLFVSSSFNTQNATYIRVCFASSVGTDITKEISLVYGETILTPYEPYKESITHIDSGALRSFEGTVDTIVNNIKTQRVNNTADGLLATPIVTTLENTSPLVAYQGGQITVQPYLRESLTYGTSLVLPYKVSKIDKIEDINGAIVTGVLASDGLSITIATANAGDSFIVYAPISSDTSLFPSTSMIYTMSATAQIDANTRATSKNAVNIEDVQANQEVIIDTVIYNTQVLEDKVDKVTGKQLSTEDYTTAEKSKLAGIAAGTIKALDKTYYEFNAAEGANVFDFNLPSSGSKSITINQGNGVTIEKTFNYDDANGNVTLTYAQAGMYLISISGDFSLTATGNTTIAPRFIRAYIGTNGYITGLFNATNLVELDITSFLTQYSSSVTYTIEKDFFYHCDKLTNIKALVNCYRIGESAFFYNLGITEMQFDEQLTSIGIEAFLGCYNLRTIIIPHKTTEITFGASAFTGVTISDLIITNNATQQQAEAIKTAMETAGATFYTNYRLLY